MSNSQELESYTDIMAHDISNINQGIMGYLELLLNKNKLDITTRRYLELIHQQVLRSSKIISDVNQLNQIRKSPYEPKDCDVIPVIERTAKHIKNIFSDRDIKIKFGFHGDQCIVKADDYLDNVIINLLSYSVLYNENNIVTVEILIEKDIVEGTPYWKFIIIDHCMGIPSDFTTAIFDKFERNRFKGKEFGLGLEIINAIINRYEGKIWIENWMSNGCHHGSKFIFIIPEGGVI